MTSFLFLSLCAAGCGSSTSATGAGLPTSPSAVASPLSSGSEALVESSPAGADSTFSGLGEVSQGAPAAVTAEAGKSKFRGEGVVTALVTGTACPTLTFNIGVHTIVTDAATVYVSGTCAGIVVGAKLDMEVTEQVGGTFLASEVEFKDKPKQKLEGEGRITAIDPVAQTITVEGHLILVPITAMILQGETPLTFAGLKVGYRVHVRALRGLDGSLTAERIMVQETGRKFVEGEARVTSLVIDTICPALQFMIGEHTIATDAATVYNGGTCADIQVGTRVQVKGTIQDDGTVLATNVHIKAKGVGGESLVSTLVTGTACPTLQFVVGGVTVHTDAATEYKGGVCTDIQIGVRVEVKGSLELDGVHASRIQIKK